MIHLVGLSGGKDSTAMALKLAESSDRYTYICTPTGDELPQMIEHWSSLEDILGKKILHLSPGLDLKSVCRKEGMLPNWRARFCTRILKIETCQKWINSQSEPVTLYIGLRADEEGREGGIYVNCEVRFPLREMGWGLPEVKGYLLQRGIKIPERTDCARCFFQRLPEWWRLWKFHPVVYQDAVDQENEFGHTFRSPSRDTWPASLADLRARFEAGDVPRGTNTESDIDFASNKCRVCSL